MIVVDLCEKMALKKSAFVEIERNCEVDGR